MARTYDLIKDLPVDIESYSVSLLSRKYGSDSLRYTTVFGLGGAGSTGFGEDVCWSDAFQLQQQEKGAVLDLSGRWTIDSFSVYVSSLDLFYGCEPPFPVYHHYRRWALESAALDLALLQAEEPLHVLLGLEPQPLRFSVSLRLGSPPNVLAVVERLQAYKDVRFKLDAEPTWDNGVIARLASTSAVDVIDFKGTYRGTLVEVETDAVLYRRCGEAFPAAYLEDPDLDSPAAAAALEDFRDRITWDVPIQSIDDVRRLVVRPTALNSKPSRLGSLSAVLDFYDWCAREGIVLYGGGQAEIGPGRDQIQLLASMFHPETPNDVAPFGWDEQDFARAGLPVSPLSPAPARTGFRRAPGWAAGPEQRGFPFA